MNSRYSSIYLISLMQGLNELKYAKYAAQCGHLVDIM